ncbi:MAG: hypothetical protein U9R36_04370 [Elusimicrobiota bacterium]|nr:hypothetical protein [Elusimicrobiota bacterium]
MKKIKLLIAGLLIVSAGCRSFPKKDVSFEEGLIAAHLEVEQEKVSSLAGEGYERGEIIRMLIISESSYLTLDEVKRSLQDGQELSVISQSVGIEPERLETEAEKIEKSIAAY